MSGEKAPAVAGFRLAILQPGTWRDYLLAITSVAIAAAGTYALQPWMPRVVMPFFFMAVILTASAAGFWPALAATVLSAIAIDRILDPAEFFGTEEWVSLLVFVITAVVTSSLTALRKNAEAVLRRQQLELEVRVAHRTQQVSAANKRLELQIVERQNAEETVRASEERFRTLFEEAPVGYHEVDRDGVIRRVNRAECELLNLSYDELVGRPVWDLATPEQREETKAQVLRKLRGEQPLEPYTRKYVTGSGGHLHLEIHERAILDASGQIAGIRSALLDITARVHAEDALRKLNAELETRVHARTAELERSNEALQQFAYSASHDLQEPLRMIGAYTRLLDKRYRDLLPEEGREFLNFIVDGTERMTHLIKDLLAFSRAGDSSAPSEDIDMQEVVRTAMSNLQRAIEETGAIISAQPMPHIKGRRAGLAQVVQNLLSNSIKYRSTSPPEITIDCSARNGEWVFSVADNGIGFKQEYAEKAFGVFQRLHGRNYPGTGIGLAICKRIIERNGGRIWAQSSPGQGATFFFTLPNTEGDVSGAATPP